MRTWLGFGWSGCARPMPDTADPINGIIGQVARVGTMPPQPDPLWVLALHDHAMDVFSGKYPWFPRIPQGDRTLLPDPEAYIRANKSWTVRQQDDLILLYRSHCLFELFDPLNWGSMTFRKMQIITAFLKWEAYEAIKNPRGINARSNMAKVLLGILIKTMEDFIYPRAGCHVKHMSFDARVRLLWATHAHLRHHFNSDFTSFEASIKKHLAEIELILINMFFGPVIMCFVRLACYTDNTIRGRFFTILLKCIRASGDMQTAFGNWLINLILQTFLLAHNGFDLFKIGEPTHAMHCEGDDNANSTVRKWGVTSEQFARLGLIVKIERSYELADLSFCGAIVCGTSAGPVAITDPVKVISQMGWGDPKYHRASAAVKDRLLVSKALSYGYQYPQCPIIRPMVDAVLRIYSHAKPDLDMIVRRSHPKRDYYPDFGVEDFKRQFPRDIQPEARQLMKRIYNVTDEAQIFTEMFFDALDRPCAFVLPALDIPVSHSEFWRQYVVYDNEPRVAATPPYTPKQLCEFVNKVAKNHERVTDWWNLRSEL